MLDIGLLDNKKMLIQELPRTLSPFEKDEIQVLVRLWDPSSFTMSPAYDIHIKQKERLENMSIKLAQLFPGENVSNFEGIKLMNAFNVYMDNLNSMRFFSLTDNNDKFMSGFPFYLFGNGSIIM